MAASIPQWTVIEATGHHHIFEESGPAFDMAASVAWADKAVTIRVPGGTEYALIQRDTKRSIHIVTRA